MFFAQVVQAASQDTTIQVAVISAIGLIGVAVVGVFSARITAGAKNESKANAESASQSAQIVLDFASALEAKDAFIESLTTRVTYLETQEALSKNRIEELELRIEEGYEQRRAAHLIEHEYLREISELRAENDRLKGNQTQAPD